MNKQKLFIESVDILVHAFKQGKLTHMSQCNCAVGNLIAYRKETYDFNRWSTTLYNMRMNGLFQNTELKDFENIPLKHVDHSTVKNSIDFMSATKYTLNEVELIERAFENVNIDKMDEDMGYQPGHNTVTSDSKEGLLRAIKVLGEIHEVPEENVSCFLKHVKNDTYTYSHKLYNDDYGSCGIKEITEKLPRKKKKAIKNSI